MLISNVNCSGTEASLHICPSSGIGNHTCKSDSKSAGVICSREFGNPYHH